MAFDNPQEANRVLIQLVRLGKEYLIDLEDAVVAIRRPDDKVNLKQSINMVGLGAASGGLSGGVLGLACQPIVPQPACRLRGRWLGGSRGWSALRLGD